MKKQLSLLLASLFLLTLLPSCGQESRERHPFQIDPAEVTSIRTRYKGTEVSHGAEYTRGEDIRAVVELLNAVVCTSQKWYPTFKVGQASTLTLETDTWSYTLEVGEDSLSFETPDYGSYCLYVEPESVGPLLELLRGERELHPDPAPYQFEVERVLYAVLQDSEKRVVLSREEDSEALGETVSLLNAFPCQEVLSEDYARRHQRRDWGQLRLVLYSESDGIFQADVGEDFFFVPGPSQETDVWDGSLYEGPPGYFQPLHDLLEDGGA